MFNLLQDKGLYRITKGKIFKKLGSIEIAVVSFSLIQWPINGNVKIELKRRIEVHNTQHKGLQST